MLPQVIKLYERCLIACANYPEYWIRYVLCMEASGSMELANNALARATQVFVKVCNFILFYFSFLYLYVIQSDSLSPVTIKKNKIHGCMHENDIMKCYTCFYGIL